MLEAEAARVQRKPERLEIGTMFEIPSLAWQLPALLKVVDFISIGSNDLLQFLFAADRGTPALSGRYDLLSPPVLDLFEQVIVSAGAAGVPVSLCGEAAARPIEAMALVGLGLSTLSMPATGILSVKALLASLDLPAFRRVLASIRQNAAGEASVREPILAWAHDQSLPI